MRMSVFQEVRFSLYITFIVCVVFFQWFASFDFKCGVTGKRCFACGLRTSVNLLLQGKFKDAYNSNKLIILLVTVVIIMIIDVCIYLYKRHSNKF